MKPGNPHECWIFRNRLSFCSPVCSPALRRLHTVDGHCPTPAILSARAGRSTGWQLQQARARQKQKGKLGAFTRDASTKGSQIGRCQPVRQHFQRPPASAFSRSLRPVSQNSPEGPAGPNLRPPAFFARDSRDKFVQVGSLWRFCFALGNALRGPMISRAQR